MRRLKWTGSRWYRPPRMRGAGIECYYYQNKATCSPAPRTLDKRATGGALVEAVASVPLGGDERKPLRADLLRIGTLAYALTGSVRLTPGETSTLIVGSDTPQGREQALTLVWLMRGMAIAPAGEPWAAFDAEPGAEHRIGPPRWWLDGTGPRAYRLVGALFRRIPGTGRKAARWGSLERHVVGNRGRATVGTGCRQRSRRPPARRGAPGAPWWTWPKGADSLAPRPASVG